jgi:hypothetical protein
MVAFTAPIAKAKKLRHAKGVFDTGIAWLTVTCNACQEQWHEIFHLKTIHPLDAGNGSRTLRLPHEKKPISFVRLSIIQYSLLICHRSVAICARNKPSFN